MAKAVTVLKSVSKYGAPNSQMCEIILKCKILCPSQTSKVTVSHAFIR